MKARLIAAIVASLIASGTPSLGDSREALPSFFGETFDLLTRQPLGAFAPDITRRLAPGRSDAARTAAPTLPSIITEGLETPPPRPPGLVPAAVATAYAPAPDPATSIVRLDIPMPVARPKSFERRERMRDTARETADRVQVAALGPIAQAPVAIGDLVRMARLDPVGRGACHVEAPFKVSAVRGLDLAPAATLNAGMAKAFARWAGPVQSAAERHLGSPIERILVAASYDCRTMNHKRRARMSEHSRANAIDVAGFVLADGRRVTVDRDWYGSGPERAFWRSVHKTTCDVFQVVLGPGSDGYHENHLHMDLSRWNVCR